MVTDIPRDLLVYLRVGPFFERPAGEIPSGLYGNVVYFWSADEALAWMEAAWSKHEKLIREGLDGAPFIIEKMRRLRKVIDAGRNWQGE